MIATILPSSTNFHAVEYNEMKVAKGKAELIEMANFGYIGMLGSYTPKDLTKLSYLLFFLQYQNQKCTVPSGDFL